MARGMKSWMVDFENGPTIGMWLPSSYTRDQVISEARDRIKNSDNLLTRPCADNKVLRILDTTIL